MRVGEECDRVPAHQGPLAKVDGDEQRGAKGLGATPCAHKAAITDAFKKPVSSSGPRSLPYIY